jgi:hypothetical protein
VPQKDTRLEAEGAEFLVLGLLLIEGIEAHKSYTRHPGYDVLAMNPAKDRVCRIQVKSRWATDWGGGFPIKNFDCDFVVLVALNRGISFRKRKTDQERGAEGSRALCAPNRHGQGRSLGLRRVVQSKSAAHAGSPAVLR